MKNIPGSYRLETDDIIREVKKLPMIAALLAKVNQDHRWHNNVMSIDQSQPDKVVIEMEEYISAVLGKLYTDYKFKSRYEWPDGAEDAEFCYRNLTEVWAGDEKYQPDDQWQFPDVPDWVWEDLQKYLNPWT